MANHASHFVDSLVFIYDTENNLIARTTVTGYGRDEMYIEVAGGLENVKPGIRLHLLIIHSTGASELSGTYKSMRQGIYEISIYGERQRDVRASARRVLNTSAVISDMVSELGTEELSAPLPVTIVNMSTTGVLISPKDIHLKTGALLQIEFNVSRKVCILYAEVVREQTDSDGTLRYGCRLHFFDR